MSSLAQQQVLPNNVKFSMDTFGEGTKKDNGYLLIHLQPITPDPVRVQRSMLKSDESEIFAGPAEPKEFNFDRDQYGYIKSLVPASECSDVKIKSCEEGIYGFQREKTHVFDGLSGDFCC